MELQTNARFYGSVFGGILGLSAASYVNGTSKIYAAAVGGFYGMCLGDHFGAVHGYNFNILLPHFCAKFGFATSLPAWMEIDGDEIAGILGGIFAGHFAAQTGVAFARGIEQENVH